MTQIVNLSGSQDINGILWGWVWGDGGPENLTFSFPTGTAEYTDNGYTSITNFSSFNAMQQTAVRTALANVASFSNLTFTETTATFAVLRYADATSIFYTTDTSVATHTKTDPLGTAEANPPELGFGGTAPFSAPYAQGDSWYNGYLSPLLGSFQYAAGIMHETGHNLGLKHGHVTQDGHGITFPMLPADHNSYEYSVMTYSQFPGDNATNGDNAPDHPTTYMQNDIAALQYLYGANYGASAHNGNTTYTWSTATGQWFIDGVGQGAPQTNFVLMTLWDGGGIDTYDFSNYTTNLSVDLAPGAWTILDTSSAHLQRADLGNNGAGGAEYFARGNIANALADPNNPTETTSLIENAVGGSGADTLLGNAIDNTLTGGGGDDTIDGQGGDDTVVYSGARSQYATSDVGGSVRIEDQRFGTPDGTDTVSNVEFFRFANRTYTRSEVLNQPPVLSPDSGSPHALTERLASTNSGSADAVSGTLPFTDDGGDTHTASTLLSTAIWSAGAIPGSTSAALASAMSASISVDSAAGLLAWQFSLTDRHVDFLAVGETLQAIYDVTIADQLGNSATRPVTIAFTGTNDAPAVDSGSSVLAKSINELPLVTGSPATDSASGVIAFSDADLNDRPTATVDTSQQTVSWQDATHDYSAELTTAQMATLLHALQIAAEAGNTNSGKIDWSYNIFDSELDFLAVGESITVTSPVIIDDHHGATVDPKVVVTLNGANDAPIAVADSNGTAKSKTVAVSASAGVLGNDSDPDVHDQDDLFVSQVNGALGNVGHTVKGSYGSLTMNADGSYVYAANKGALPAKIVAQDTFAYTVADGHGGTDTSTLSIVVFNPGVSYQAGINTTLNGGNGPDVLDGSAGHDILLGGNGPDVLIGGDGDTLTGGNGPDTFLFRPNFGANTITDFNTNIDAIQFDRSLFTSATDILNHTTDTTGGAVITDATGDTVTLVGVTLAQLHAIDFFLA